MTSRDGDRATSRWLPLLEKVGVASPCSVPWEDMEGDLRVRFCGKCEKNVFNLSAMSREEAAALLETRGGKVCVRFYRRADGTMLTSDCPVGISRKGATRAAAVAGAFLSALAASGCSLATQGDPPVPEMPLTPAQYAPRASGAQSNGQTSPQSAASAPISNGTTAPVPLPKR